MASTMAFAGEHSKDRRYRSEPDMTAIWDSIDRLASWLEEHEYRGYDTFDGLSSPILRPFTFETKLLRTLLQQGVRRFPINLRPVLGITREHSSKGMGFLARGFIRLYQATGDQKWQERAQFALQWLVENRSPEYTRACWGNHFDYQSRGFYLPKGVPTVVWTSLIGHAFLDAYEHFHERRYLDVATSACEHILQDLEQFSDGKGVCITYVPGLDCRVHNANVLGGGFLARAYGHTRNGSYRDLAERALQYTAQHQRLDASWYYGEKANLHWVDNFHTAYVLDSFRHYSKSTGDTQFDEILAKGYDFWKRTFFLADGRPRYYDHKTLPIDIQCCSQAIDTLVFFSDTDPQNVSLALTIARWTIANMQDRSGYFYYRRYSRWLANKAATLHWGQATMMCALANLYKSLAGASHRA